MTIDLAEGSRFLTLFEFLDGEPLGEDLADVETTGRGLALIHQIGEAFRGPPSLRKLELPHLLDAPLELLLSAPTMSEALRQDYEAIGGLLRDRVKSCGDLSRVECHGDCHGNNNFMTDDAAGTRIASFFDFDDAGSGFRAYDLSVYLWAIMPRTFDSPLSGAPLERWRSYVRGYRSAEGLSASDWKAVAPFVAIRNLWLLSEYAGQASVWGTQLLPTTALKKQAQLLKFWAGMDTPE